MLVANLAQPLVEKPFIIFDWRRGKQQVPQALEVTSPKLYAWRTPGVESNELEPLLDLFIVRKVIVKCLLVKLLLLLPDRRRHSLSYSAYVFMELHYCSCQKTVLDLKIFNYVLKTLEFREALRWIKDRCKELGQSLDGKVASLP